MTDSRVSHKEPENYRTRDSNNKPLRPCFKTNLESYHQVPCYSSSAEIRDYEYWQLYEILHKISSPCVKESLNEEEIEILHTVLVIVYLY